MLLRAIDTRRIGTIWALAGLVIFSVVLLYPVSRLYVSDHISRLPWPSKASPSAAPSQPPPPSSESSPIADDKNDLPDGLPEYAFETPQSTTCTDRFSSKYLEDYRDHSISYCSPESRSDITCFHSRSRTDGMVDSLCFAEHVSFDAARRKFQIDCAFREVTEAEKQQGLIPFDQIRGYWYETGPANVFQQAVDVISSEPKAESRSSVPQEEHHQDIGDSQSVTSPARNFLLVKREGETNPWHSLVEIFSTLMTFDVLRLSSNPRANGAPFFDASHDISDTQVVILDDRTDGPYFDLWTLFASRKPIRLEELAADASMTAAMKDSNIIVPLPGGSNPLWQPELEVQQCTSAPTVSVFAQRVLKFYGVPDPEPPKPEHLIRVTFVDRKSRRLLNQTALFAELGERNPHVAIRFADFADMSFAEQLRITRETDILVGVHGAGLTHSIFMRPKAGVVVEIQPRGMDHYGFRMVATMLGLNYFHVHAEHNPREGKRDTLGRLRKRDGWHWDDIRIEPDRFLDLMETAIRSMYSKGPWNFDVN